VITNTYITMENVKNKAKICSMNCSLIIAIDMYVIIDSLFTYFVISITLC